MSGSPLVYAVQERLHDAGYSDLPTPFKVAGVEFAFTGAMRGRDGRALDLVLLIDTTTGDFGDRDGDRVRQRVEALSRALDVTGSRYVVTVILAGAVLAEGIEALSETCRVLQVEGVTFDDQGKPVDEIAKRQLDDRIRVLLPLTLPVPVVEAQNSSGPAMDQLVRALPANTNIALVDALIAASSDGEQAVTDAVALAIDGAFQSEPEEAQS
ncbi:MULTISPECIES: hypothetical protein [unclassified Nitrobacter]|uniref:hypothetical protein n=1 Tax=unclassified Nitrobacter TaxID=2620411 RepID=UPI000925CC1F|nr:MULTISPECIES: hypothetical protein [unclassified Nitrobacter]MBN9149723.1 hypothetical protein [Nitrobacter sp.]OJV00234.1 MAG: hypothetical protein BGO16_08580 [Nitrobacter sp. 62-23]